MIKGRVIEVISDIVKLELEDNRLCDANIKGIFRKDDIFPVVGDNVLVEVFKDDLNTIKDIEADKEQQEQEEKNKKTAKGIICEILERNIYIKRPKLANITKLFFVVSIDKPKPDLLMLDKQIAFAELLNLEIVIVFNKSDLGEQKFIDEIKSVYENIGYKVIVIQANESENNKELLEINKCLENNISAFSGNSGVGKSTLINSIFNKSITLEGEISRKNKKGKNTTTSTKLYKIGDNTYIADTPGFSTFSIEEISYRDLDKYYKEFKEHISKCEFIGCTHIKEKNCGVKIAAKENIISKKRYDRYIKIYEELKLKEERKRW